MKSNSAKFTTRIIAAILALLILGGVMVVAIQSII